MSPEGNPTTQRQTGPPPGSATTPAGTPAPTPEGSASEGTVIYNGDGSAVGVARRGETETFLAGLVRRRLWEFSPYHPISGTELKAVLVSERQIQSKAILDTDGVHYVLQSWVASLCPGKREADGRITAHPAEVDPTGLVQLGNLVGGGPYEVGGEEHHFLADFEAAVKMAVRAQERERAVFARYKHPAKSLNYQGEKAQLEFRRRVLRDMGLTDAQIDMALSLVANTVLEPRTLWNLVSDL